MEAIELAELLIDLGDIEVEVLSARYDGTEDRVSYERPVVIVNIDLATITPPAYALAVIMEYGWPFTKAKELAEKAIADGFLRLK